jgi:hypothetical protein
VAPNREGFGVCLFTCTEYALRLVVEAAVREALEAEGIVSASCIDLVCRHLRLLFVCRLLLIPRVAASATTARTTRRQGHRRLLIPVQSSLAYVMPSGCAIRAAAAY